MQRNDFAMSALCGALAAAAIGLAAERVDNARDRALFSERVNYNRHIILPSEPDRYYEALGFRPADIRAGAPVPRRIPARLPEGLDRFGGGDARKEAFVALMLPAILRSNELILEDRRRLIALAERRERGALLAPRERRWLLRLAREYGLKPGRVADIDFRILRRRVDAIPVSLALAQAAIESGWGTSRFAREGNAIFGQWTWDDSHDGIVPAARAADETHRIRAFAYLIDSVRGYARNLNRNPAYVRFREQRDRAAGTPVDPLALAGTLISYSTRREAYVEDLLSIIRFNRLTDFDQARLEPRHRSRPKRPAGTVS